MCSAKKSTTKSKRISLKNNTTDQETTMESSSHSYHIETKRVALHQKSTQSTDACSQDSSSSSRSIRSRRSNYASSSSASSKDDDDENIHAQVTGCYSDIFSDYRILNQVIGSGNYGKVRECVHRRTRRRFAVKSIDKSKIARLDHLRREISLLTKVDHANIARIENVFEDAKYVHIVTDNYSGGELFDKIVENTSHQGCFSEHRAAKIIKSLLEAVAYLHKKNIAHRDIKPENILFESSDEDADIKLIDFGLARKHNSKSDKPMATPVGTAYYMSPEVLNNKYDKSCDLWSVGVICYTLLTGYPPFNGHDDAEIFESTLNSPLCFPEGFGSSEAKDFVRCLLRKDARKRFTASEALEHPWIVSLGECGISSSAKNVDAILARLNRLRAKATYARNL